jgi:hypothetical protein
MSEHELTIYDPERKKKVFIELKVDPPKKEEASSSISIKKTVERTADLIKDKLTEDLDNPARCQAYPLMIECIPYVIHKILGSCYASLVENDTTTRQILAHIMLIGFYLSKLFQDKHIKIVTREEELTDREAEDILRIDEGITTITMLAQQGFNRTEVIKDLIRSGRITIGDLKEMGIEEGKIQEIVDSLHKSSEEN